MKRRLPALCAALSVLSGCITLGDEAPAVAEPAAPKASETRAEQGSPDTEVARAIAAPRVEYPNVDTLNGLSSENIEMLLGTPHFRRRDKPAELWQYRARDCVIDLFFYPGGSAGLAVEYMDVRLAPGRETARQACFVSLLKAHGDGDNG